MRTHRVLTFGLIRISREYYTQFANVGECAAPWSP